MASNASIRETGESGDAGVASFSTDDITDGGGGDLTVIEGKAAVVKADDTLTACKSD